MSCSGSHTKNSGCPNMGSLYLKICVNSSVSKLSSKISSYLANMIVSGCCPKVVFLKMYCIDTFLKIGMSFTTILLCKLYLGYSRSPCESLCLNTKSWFYFCSLITRFLPEMMASIFWSWEEVMPMTWFGSLVSVIRRVIGIDPICLKFSLSNIITLSIFDTRKTLCFVSSIAMAPSKFSL